ncbi:taurine dioxygenase [Marinobacter sp. MBR-99]|jgi:taurine dioxygenase|uniref:TauD/TfdA dioxygenase family protein n=1 Tax=Marinobacter sp. MBR-99 TaxID=3156461 RepID=UPI00339B96ED
MALDKPNGAPQIIVEPFRAALGADISGVDLSQAQETRTSDAIRQALEDHLVLRFREQSLSDPALIRFSQLFGELQPAPPTEHSETGHLKQYPEIFVISNIVEDGIPLGTLGNGEAEWHTDMSYLEITPGPTILHALEVTRTGGRTSLCNMYKAYEALPVELKRKIVSLTCKHDSSYTSAGDLRRGAREVERPDTAPGAVHPLVRIHPGTGRRALFLGRRSNAYIPGLSLEESETLLETLWSYATRPEHVWTQDWQVGDVLIWDNRWTMHCRESFDELDRRLMHRTQVAGERPLGLTDITH